MKRSRGQRDVPVPFKKTLAYAGDNLTDRPFDLARRMDRLLQSRPDQTDEHVLFLLECGTRIPGKQSFYAQIIAQLPRLLKEKTIDALPDHIADKLSLPISHPELSLAILFLGQLVRESLVSPKDFHQCLFQLSHLLSNPSFGLFARQTLAFNLSLVLPMPSKAISEFIASTSKQSLNPSLLQTFEREPSFQFQDAIQCVEAEKYIWEPIHSTSCRALRFNFQSCQVSGEFTSVHFLIDDIIFLGAPEITSGSIRLLHALSHTLGQFRKEPRKCVHRLTCFPKMAIAFLFPLIFSEALSLRSAVNPMYFARVNSLLLEKDFETFGPLFSDVVHRIFTNLDKLSYESKDRFALLFAYNVSHFDLEWPWDRWESIHREDSNARRFISTVLYKVSLFLYREVVSEKVSKIQWLQDLMPQEPDFIPQDVPDQLIDCIKGSESLESYIDDILDESEAVVLVIAGMLESGMASFTHIFALLESHCEVLKRLLSSDQSRQQAIQTVAQCWHHSPQHITLVLGQFLQLSLLSSVDIGSWLMEDMKGTIASHVVFMDLFSIMIRRNEQLLADETSREPKDFLLLIFQQFYEALESAQEDSEAFAVTAKLFHQFALKSLQLCRKTEMIPRVHQLLFKNASQSVSDCFSYILEMEQRRVEFSGNV